MGKKFNSEFSRFFEMLPRIVALGRTSILNFYSFLLSR